MAGKQSLVHILKAELNFLEQGGYRPGPRYPWRPKFVFEDSPTCINFQNNEDRRPCGECPLMDFVPADRKNTPFPCRHIQLTARGETVNSFYEWGTDQELEGALREWLWRTIRELETGEKAEVQAA